MILELFLGAVAAAVIWIYKHFHDRLNYWSLKNVPHQKGRFPLGSTPNLSFSTNYQGHDIQYYYKKFDPHPFCGIYLFDQPQLVIRDPEIIKLILVKDFSHFRNRAAIKNAKTTVMGRNLFQIEGEPWRTLRVKLTPTFTSGKLKNMSEIFEVCSRQLVDYLERNVERNDSVVNVKETIGRFTTDIIVSCAFGLESNSIENPESSPFRQVGKTIIQFEKKTFGRTAMRTFVEYFPDLRHLVKPKFFKKIENFLIGSIQDTIEYRKKNGVKRNDFLNLLIELMDKNNEEKATIEETKDTEKIDFDVITIAAQCFLFFIAGFETSSSVQTFTLYLLAQHQDIQDRARAEIRETLSRHQGKMTYHACQELPYLDQVINESMRLYPTLAITTRVCTMDYRIPGTDTVIDKGTKILIPVYALHHDDKYFPEPEKFDPDRFSKENEGTRTPFTYLPFGEGPRHCIGMRFGFLQAQFGLASILSHFKVLLSDETEVPLTLGASNNATLTRDPIKLKFEKL